MATELEKLNGLISAIEKGNYNEVKTAVDIDYANEENERIERSIVNLKNGDKKTPLQVAVEQINPNGQIVKLLIESGADPDVQDSNGETLLCLLIKNRTLWNSLSQEDRDLLVDKSDINYTYTGSFDQTKQKIQFDNYLHIAARVRNMDAFLFIFKKSIENNILLLEYNENHENPFHVAAKTRILPAVVKGMFEHLELIASDKIKTLENSIEEAKEAKSDKKESKKKLREVKEKLKGDKSYIVEALRSECALNKDKKTPFGCISKIERKGIKKAGGIEDKPICNKNFHLCLYIIGDMVSIAALCLSLYLLFLTAKTFALSSISSMAFAGVTYLSLKACTEIHNLHNDGASMQDVGMTQVSEGLAV